MNVVNRCKPRRRVCAHVLCNTTVSTVSELPNYFLFLHTDSSPGFQPLALDALKKFFPDFEEEVKRAHGRYAYVYGMDLNFIEADDYLSLEALQITK